MRWWTFIKERFPPFRHLSLILFFFFANSLLALNFSDLPASIVNGSLSFIVVLLVFFHLRVFDEIKDYQTDTLIHPDRPLARGLIPVKEAKQAAFGLIAVELAISLTIGIPAFLAACFMIGYSLLMYREFFIGSWLRPKLSTYALTHTIVSCWISLFLFSAMTGLYFWTIPLEYGAFVLANWMIFNVFEFGRKTFGKKEEQQKIDSYSKKFGSWGAAAIVLLMAAAAGAMAFLIGFQLHFSPLFFVLLGLLFATLFSAALFYGASNTASFASRFRGACSAFILFYNVIFSLGGILC